MYFLYVVLIKVILPTFQSIFFGTLLCNKDEKNSEARLVINLRLYKNAKEKNEQKIWNRGIHINPKFKIFNCASLYYNGSSFLLNLQLFKRFSVSFSMIFL